MLSKTYPWRLPAILLIAIALVLVAASPAEARWRIRRVQIASGVTLLKIKDSRGPNQIRVLKIDPREAATVDVGLAGRTWPAYAKTSAMAKAYGAIGAINADFNERGHPLHPYWEDGEVETSGLALGTNFAITADERDVAIRPTPVRSKALDLALKTAITIGRWNAGASHRRHQVAAYTYQGGSAERPPQRACFARLAPSGPPSWSTSKDEIVRGYTVDRRVCRRDPLAPREPGNVVLASTGRRSAAAAWIKGLAQDGAVRLRWALEGMSKTLDTQGGQPLLLRRGTVVAPASCGSYFCNRNPRTGIGYTRKGRVLFVTVDGRQSDSVGMTLPAFARVFKRLGGRWALNFDGGGSTTMVARLRTGLRIVNDPSPSTGERSVPSVMLVLPRADGGEPSSLTSIRAIRTAAYRDVAEGPREAARAWRAAMLDPGSTGGLLSALANGAFGFEGELSPDLMRVVKRYRAAGLR